LTSCHYLRIMIINKTTRRNCGFTFIEVLVTIVIMAILIGTVGYMYVAGIRLWDQGYTRADIRSKMTQALELMTKSLRQASSIDALTAGAITLTADLGGGSTQYFVHMYHAGDSAPNPPYTQDGYELRWAEGSTTYGAGRIIATNIDRPSPPSSNPFSQSGNVITMNFTVEDGDQSIDMRTNVRVRNN